MCNSNRQQATNAAVSIAFTDCQLHCLVGRIPAALVLCRVSAFCSRSSMNPSPLMSVTTRETGTVISPSKAQNTILLHQAIVMLLRTLGWPRISPAR